MRRRDLLKRGTAFTGGVSLAALINACTSPKPTAESTDEAKPAADAGKGSEPAVLTVVQGGGFPNGLDLHQVGTNRPAYGISWCLYDRLVTFGTKTLDDGSLSYDYTVIEPELAESWTVADDELSVTFNLRKDATFHDGTPITAKDVKWSYDRAVSVGGFPSFQMKAGALESSDQFVVVDDHTFQVIFLRKDKLTLIDMAVPIPAIMNSTLIEPNITEEDPWGLEWTNANPAGGGAYKLDTFKPEERVTLVRNDDWKSGPAPAIEKIIWLNVPEAGNRRALLEKGDVDINYEVSEKDISELKATGKYTVVSTPIENCLYTIDLNAQPELAGAPNPFSDVKVRQAVAYAMPYDAIVDTALYGECVKMYGGKDFEPKTLDWPQPYPYSTDMAKAKSLIAESGYPDGFDTTLAFNLGTQEWAEPFCVLVKESLAEIGINATLEKVPGSNFRAVLVEKSRPMIVNNFGGWLNYPDYFFFYSYHGQNATFNGSSYQNPELDKLVDAALASGPGDPAYEKNVKGFLKIAFEEMPRIVVAQPYLSAAMQTGVSGYQYWFHRQLDYRQLKKA
ncbi:ABC transporter substrate-binding protein [Leptothoe spongobia]|uniref:ABC transporter substrate-binding protein n=1 Tax=Leptothoe spongobia TAU-MAC 1115 TaxID=1967444 RepID=A0A947DDI6_9CYAN|nr:ABC transporter substrate-binding protein [Leptothoe spongobia]MBT9314554.1 ABC transporter substrate-binding protein [Leptothoe spongobia TAU-MAC 1115]